MKWILALGFLCIAALLITIAYQVNRSTWSPEDKACYSIFGSAKSEADCRQNLQLQQALSRLDQYHVN